MSSRVSFNVLGLMSGTSLDGLDVVHCLFEWTDRWSFEILAAETFSYDEVWRNRLANAHALSGIELAVLHAELGKLHGHKMIAAMQGEDALADVTFDVSINRCFDFCEVNNVWEEVVQDGDCLPARKNLKQNPEAEPFFHAAKEIVVEWTRAHMDAVVAKHGSHGVDTAIASQLIFALVGESMHHYFAPEATPELRARIRSEVVRFCNGAVGQGSTHRA